MLTALIGVKPPAKLLAVFGKRQRQFAPECARLSQAFVSILGASLYGLLVASALPVCGQTSNSDASVSTASASVLNLVRWAGYAPEAAGRTVNMSFALYQDPVGGLPLWTEAQEVTVGADGRYSALLGATSAEGLPKSLFQSGDARWIEAKLVGAQLIASTGGDAVAEAANEAPPARKLLAAVPYAFKSMDAETLDGRAATDYVTRENLESTVDREIEAVAKPDPIHPGHLRLLGTETLSTGPGQAGYVPLWTGAASLGASIIAQSGQNVGIGTSTPATMLDVNGTSTLRAAVSLLASAATLATGVNSPALQLGASAYSSTTNASVPQNFVWQAQSSGNNTASPTANLSLLFGSGTTTPTPTGLSIAPNGQITFAPGQTFPGTSGQTGPTSSTLTGITAGPGLTGGGSSGNVTLALAWPISTANGGTGAATPAAALANLGGQPAMPGINSDGQNGLTISNNLAVGTALPVGARAGTVGGNVIYTPNGKQNALAFGAVGDGVTDDYAPILATVAAARSTGNCAYFPARVYAFNSPIVISPAGKRSGSPICIEFETGAWFKYTGASTTDAFYLDASGSLNGQIFDLHNVAIDGNGRATNGIHTNLAVGSVFDRLRVKNVTGAGIILSNSYDNHLERPTVSLSADAMTTIPVNGIIFDRSTATTMVDPKFEGLSGACIYIKFASTIVSTGGTAEGCSIGVEVDAPSQKDSIVGIDLESNSTWDIKTSASSGTFISINSGSAKGLLLTGNAVNNLFIGSAFKFGFLDSANAQQNGFIQTNIPLFSDLGTNTFWIESNLNGVLTARVPMLIPTNSANATQLTTTGWLGYQSGSSLVIRDTVNGANFMSFGPGTTGTVTLQAGHTLVPSGGVDLANGSTGSGAFLRMLDQGSCTMTSGACASVTLNHTYTTAPVCLGNWTGSGTLVGALKMPTTTTSVTPASSVGTDTAVVSYVCFGK